MGIPTLPPYLHYYHTYITIISTLLSCLHYHSLPTLPFITYITIHYLHYHSLPTLPFITYSNITNINTILNIYKYKYNTSTYDNVLKSSSKVRYFLNFQTKQLSELLGSSLLSCFLSCFLEGKSRPMMNFTHIYTCNSKYLITLSIGFFKNLKTFIFF